LDASQENAVAESVGKGKALVVREPPGNWKSQLIAGIWFRPILLEGKSAVVFSEKEQL